jgi:hypothetical protein
VRVSKRILAFFAILLIIMVKDSFLIRDGFITRHLLIRLAGGIDVALPDAGGVHTEHRDQLLQLLAFAGRAGRWGFQNQGFKLLPAIQAFKIV